MVYILFVLSLWNFKVKVYQNVCQAILIPNITPLFVYLLEMGNMFLINEGIGTRGAKSHDRNILELFILV